MDPVANMLEQKALAEKILDDPQRLNIADVLRLAELVEAQDQWRREGGFDPYVAQPEILA